MLLSLCIFFSFSCAENIVLYIISHRFRTHIIVNKKKKKELSLHSNTDTLLLCDPSG